MPEWSEAYQEATLAARNEALTSRGIPRQAYQQLYQEYASFLEDVRRDLEREAITSDRAQTLERLLSRRMQQLANRAGIIFDDAQDRMIELGIQGHVNGFSEASRITGVGVSVNFDAVPDRVLDLMMLRRGFSSSKDFKSVLKRGLTDVAGDIDRFLSSVVARGVSSERAYRELGGIFVQNDQTLSRLVRDGRLMKSTLNESLKEGVIDLADYNKARTALFDARRIVVTENNNAFRESALQSAIESPVVGYAKWNVSGRHYGLPSSPDVCTVWHESDLFGVGAGVFPLQNFPSAPHPWCGCYKYDVLRTPDQWNEPKPQAMQPPDLTESRFEDMFKDKTENHLKRQIEISNGLLKSAYRYAERVRGAA